MPSKEKFLDYEPLSRGRKPSVVAPHAAESNSVFADAFPEPAKLTKEDTKEAEAPAKTIFSEQVSNWMVRRGHTLSFIGIFLFTLWVYLRPYEFSRSLMPLSTMAFWIAAATLIAFVPNQLALEGNLTARPREVNFLLLFSLTVLFSVPLADDPGNSWRSVVDFSKVLVVFVIMVNVVRTETRLKWMLLLLLAISCFLGINAIRNYRAGVQLIEGFRVWGSIGNMFHNPNDMALHMVTMVPISVGLFLGSRGPLKRLLYIVCTVLIFVGLVLTFSRGGLVGMICAVGVLVWKLRRRHRFIVGVGAVVLGGAFILFAPGGVASRFSTVFDQDEGSSVGARKDDLKRSILVTMRNPLVGIGIGNYMLRSNRGLATHNSYTQVSAEVGVPAIILYVLFIVTPLKRLRTLEHKLLSEGVKSRFYYLAVGMQASLVGYMVSSFFASVAFLWYIYYLVALSVCTARIYEVQNGINVDEIARSGPDLIAPAKEPRIA